MNKAVLVCGMGRSGTNLLRRIVGSHSDIAMPPVEFQFFQSLDSGKTVQQILSAENFQQRYQLDVSDLYHDAPETVYKELLARYAKSINKPVAGEKTPRNEFYYERILKSLDGFDIRFIQIVRNPFDMLASYKHAPFRKKALVQAETVELVEDWLRSLSIGLARSFSNPEKYRVIKYEKLTSDPAKETQKLCEFLDVDFQPDRMLNLVDFSEHKDNTSFSDQDTKNDTQNTGLVKRAKSRKDHLTPEEIQMVVFLCSELAQSFGYFDEAFSQEFAHKRSMYQEESRMRRKLKGLAKRMLGMH